MWNRPSSRRRLLAGIVGTFCLAGGASLTAAGQISLAWDPAAGASGYRVHYGTASGQYSTSVDVGGATQTTLTGIQDCQVWYFAVTAYNAAGESGFSNEVSSLPKPFVSSIAPSSAMQGEQVTLVLQGANFEAGAQLSVANPHVGLGTPSVVCDRAEVAVSVDPPAPGVRAAEVGTFPVTISNPNGFEIAADFQITLDPARLDVNKSEPSTDGRLDGQDTVWLSRRFGAAENDPLYHPDFDFNGDGWIDGEDLALLAGDFGGCWTGSSWSPSACQNP